MEFCKAAKELLWSGAGAAARDWLRQRGLSDETIKAAGLGLNLQRGYQPAEEWATEADVWVERGIVIPWRIGSSLWFINIRRPDKDIELALARGGVAAKYVSIASGSECLYGFDTIRAGLPLVLVEGEFDRLALLQAMNHTIAVVATGGIGKAQGERWVKAIRRACPVIVAFDYDSNKAGDKSAVDWVELVGACRYTPWAHDVNDMLTKGVDIQEWVGSALKLAYLEDDEAALDEPLLPVEIAPVAELLEPYKPTPFASQEELLLAARGLADMLGPGGTVIIPPPGYTLAQHSKLLQEQRDREWKELEKAKWARERAQRAKPKSIKWTREQVRKRDYEAERAAEAELEEDYEIDRSSMAMEGIC